MWLLSTWLGRAVGLLIGILIVAGGAVGYAYAADAAIDADVVSKSCAFSGESLVKVRTRLFGLDHEEALDFLVCQAVPKTGFVQYHLRSERTILFETEDGRCIWDSANILC